MLFSDGSNDIRTWRYFADMIDSHGVDYMYRNVPYFNHPPLMGYYSQMALRLSRYSSISFPYVFKTPLIVVDVALVYFIFLIRKPLGNLKEAQLAATFYALNLTAVLVSSFHGNTDTFCAAAWLLSAWFATQSRDFAAGAALSLAINIKLIPVLAIPVMLASCLNLRNAIRFLLGLCLGVIPFLPFLWKSWPFFYRNAIKYNSNIDYWGIELLAFKSGDLGFVPKSLAVSFGTFYYENGRYFILFAILLTAIWAARKGRQPFAAARLVPIWFLVFTPGWGVQYMVYAAPLLAAWQPKEGIRYGTMAGAFIGLIYLAHWTGSFPVFSLFQGKMPLPAQLLGFVTWLYLAQLGWRTFRQVPN